MMNNIINNNFLVICFDQYNQIDSNSLNELRQIINEVIVFNHPDECVDHLTNITNKKVFMIVLNDSITYELISFIHDYAQLQSIYIFSTNNLTFNHLSKVKETFTSIKTICESIEKEIKQCNHDHIPISILSSNDIAKQNLNELSPSFMYTQILKEIIYDINYHDPSQNAKEDLVNFWYQQYSNNEPMLKKIGEFERNYRSEEAIHWYTRENFVYSILNQALRTLDVNVILKMGFFLRDLCQQIKSQFDQQSMYSIALIVYRGQGIEKEEFEKMQNSPNGLLSFNGFVSTSKDRVVSEMFCPLPQQDPNIIPVLFKIQLNKNSKSVPFCSVESRTQFNDEDEILFSMHSIFRIVELKMEHADNGDYWEVTLKLTDDNDKDLKRLTDYIRNEISDLNGWLRLGLLLIKMSEFDKAEEIYKILLEQAIQSNDALLSPVIYSQLGLVKHYKEKFNDALKYYRKSISSSGFLQLNPSYTSTVYNNIASVYVSQGKYNEALPYYQQAARIESPTHPDSALTFNNMGKMYKDMGRYQEALEFYEKALEIYLSSSIHENHPALVNTYNNIAMIYYELGHYPKSKQYITKALTIGNRSLPFKHPYRTATYNCLGLLHKKDGDYSKALEFYNKALESYQPTNSLDDLIYASVCNNIGCVYLSQQKYSKTVEFFKRTVDIEEKYLPKDHPTLARTYNNIAAVYHEEKNYSMALEYYQKALSIYNRQNQEQPDLAHTLNNIGVANFEQQHYSTALDYFQHAIEISQRTLPSDHPKIQEYKENADLAKDYLNPGSVSTISHAFKNIFSNIFRR